MKRKSLLIALVVCGGCDFEVAIGSHDAGNEPQCPDAGRLGEFRFDPTFGDCGRVLFDIGQIDNLDFGVQGASVGSDGKLVVVGIGGRAGNEDLLAVRLLPNGQFDPAFGFDGQVSVDVQGTLESAEGVTHSLDGKIVVVGLTNAAPSEQAVVLRLLEDGRRDPAFADGGLLLLGQAPERLLFNSVLGLPDGRLRCGGHVWSAANPSPDLRMYGLLASGEIDSSFGSAGIVTAKFIGDDFGGLSAVDSSGRLLLAGGGWNGSDLDFEVIRLLADGQLDLSFGAGTGRALVDIGGGDDSCVSVLSQRSGRLICAGAAKLGGHQQATVIALRESGARDLAFGTTGTVQLDWGPESKANTILPLPDGTLLVVGGESNHGGRVAMAILSADGAVQATTLDLVGEANGVAADPATGDLFVVGRTVRQDGDFVVLKLTQRPEPNAIRLNVGCMSTPAGGLLSPMLVLLFLRRRRFFN